MFGPWKCLVWQVCGSEMNVHSKSNLGIKFPGQKDLDNFGKNDKYIELENSCGGWVFFF